MPAHDPATGEPDPKLAIKLFNLVETEQGFAHISDGCEILSRKEIIAVARASLEFTNIVRAKLTRFLREYA